MSLAAGMGPGNAGFLNMNKANDINKRGSYNIINGEPHSYQNSGQYTFRNAASSILQ